MTDLISLFKKDIFNLIDDLKNKKLINKINNNSISIDYSSNSRQGDLSTNILLILLNNVSKPLKFFKQIVSIIG